MYPWPLPGNIVSRSKVNSPGGVKVEKSPKNDKLSLGSVATEFSKHVQSSVAKPSNIKQTSKATEL